jgi:4-coumarate--CoA ligase
MLFPLFFSHPHDGVLALIDHSTGSSISYSKLLALVKSMASSLHKMGVLKGDVVLLLLPNSIYTK